MTRLHSQASTPVTIDDTLRLTTSTRHVKITVDNKETHELGRGQTVHLRAGMDATRATKEERKTVSLRNQARRAELASTHLEICCSCFQIGDYEQAGDTSETEQIGIIPKNDIGPSEHGKLIDGP